MVYNMLASFAGISGAMGVGLGAIGAHAIKNKLNAYRMFTLTFPSSRSHRILSTDPH